MDASDVLYQALKPDLQRISSILFEFGEQQIRKNGVFLPFGATLTRGGDVALEAASTGEDVASATEILPLLHGGMRSSARERDVVMIAVCEWVKITPYGGKQADAMKVLIEHEQGLTVAFYVPCRKRLFGGWVFEPMIVRPAEPEVRPWAAQVNSSS